MYSIEHSSRLIFLFLRVDFKYFLIAISPCCLSMHLANISWLYKCVALLYIFTTRKDMQVQFIIRKNTILPVGYQEYTYNSLKSPFFTYRFSIILIVKYLFFLSFLYFTFFSIPLPTLNCWSVWFTI